MQQTTLCRPTHSLNYLDWTDQGAAGDGVARPGVAERGGRGGELRATTLLLFSVCVKVYPARGRCWKLRWPGPNRFPGAGWLR